MSPIPSPHLAASERDPEGKEGVCSRCLMDRTDPDIIFDEKGVCNHCHHYDELAAKCLLPGAARERAREELVARIKKDAAGKSYDCVIGVSGGVDSTYVAYLVKQLGLRPLAVHLDNGWDSELAVANIEKTLRALEIDLYTHVIDWEEFKDLQLAFLRASTPDAEIPTDHAILALLYDVAARYGVRHVILGTNVMTEATMPRKWGYGYYDLRYIGAIHRRFGSRKLRTYPKLGLARLAYYYLIKRIRTISILNYIHYDKSEAMKTIERELGWVYYGGKHYESIYTRFFQAYILPRKFSIDKRKAHYSDLIFSGQLTRIQAQQMLGKDVSPADKLAEDKDYVIKKLGLTPQDFEEIMASQTMTFLHYPNQHELVRLLKRIVRLAERVSDLATRRKRTGPKPSRSTAGTA